MACLGISIVTLELITMTISEKGMKVRERKVQNQEGRLRSTSYKHCCTKQRPISKVDQHCTLNAKSSLSIQLLQQSKKEVRYSVNSLDSKVSCLCIMKSRNEKKPKERKVVNLIKDYNIFFENTKNCHLRTINHLTHSCGLRSRVGE